MINISKYFCKKCKRFHYHGKIYEDHLKYNDKEKNKKNISKNLNLKSRKENKIQSKKVMDFNYDTLRPIAKRQIDKLFDKMRTTHNNDLYVFQINKLIIHEQNRGKKG